MEQHPAELKIKILCSINDFHTLYSFICASKSFYSVFRAAQSSILVSVYKRSIPLVILRDALAVQSSSSYSRHYNDQLYLMVHRLKEPLPNYPSLESVSFKCLTHFARIVEWFTDDMCKTITQTKPSLSLASLPLSFEERIRISRAFYRFEIYCKLCRDSTKPDATPMDIIIFDQLLLFLRHIPPWEGEELACVHNYLRNKLSVLDEACLEYGKDVNANWGFGGDISKDRLRPDSMKEMAMALDLQLLYKLFTANPPNISVCGSSWLAEQIVFLWLDMLWPIDLQSAPGHLRFAELFCGTGINSPSPGWIWAHANKHTAESGDLNKADIREWGYCLWSGSRLQISHLSDELWEAKDYQG